MFERAHRALYAALDRFPSRKGAAIHIDRFARALFDTFDGGALLVLGGPDLPLHQVEGPVEIARFAREVPNFLERALQFGDWVARAIDRMEGSLELCHFRDPWAGAPIALHPQRKYKVVYEVNALPSIELPTLYPDLGARTIDKIRAMEMDCCAAADLLVTPSQTTAQFLKSLGVSKQIEVIPNGADLDAPVQKPEDAPNTYILYFGAAQSWQGIDTLLRAFARLADFESLRLVFCASRDSKSWRGYQRLAAKLGVAERIVWKYALEEPELARWRQHALVSVAPLTDSPRNVVQGCAPLKILESMASGAAVVASDVAPVRELIRDRENGWLVHPDRPAELARAIRILVEHPDRARELGTSARRTIEERFTWERSTAALQRAYRDLVRKGARADERAEGVAISRP